MTVVCVNNSYGFGAVLLHKDGITVNKTYVVKEVRTASNYPSTFYLIENDNGHEIEYSKDHFNTLSELRDNKLTELGIN